MAHSLRPVSILFGVLVDKLSFIAAALALASFVDASTPAFGNLALALGLMATAGGAFVAGRHAHLRPLAHGVAVGAIAVLISFGRFLVDRVWTPEVDPAHPLWWELLGWSGALLAGALGGALAARSLRGREPPDPGASGTRWNLWSPILAAIVLLFAFVEQLGRCA